MKPPDPFDQRTKNRIREHAPHGLKPSDIPTSNTNTPGMTLFDCPCGWLGWLNDAALDEIRRLQIRALPPRSG